MLKYVLAWFPMIVLAIVNGFIREKFLVNKLNELSAHQVSTLSVIVLIGVYVWFLFRIWFPVSMNQVIHIGVLWFFFTAIFEFLFGHYVAGYSWNTLLQDYNILNGRVWVFVLIWISVVPYIVYKIQKYIL